MFQRQRNTENVPVKPARRARRFPLAGRLRRAGALLAGLAVLGVATPASAQALTWSVVPSPSPSVQVNLLQAVSCISATQCTAAGDYTRNKQYKTLIEAEDGTGWSVVPSPSPGSTDDYLNGVSCASATACTAVGSVSHVETLFESWNGTKWSAVTVPDGRRFSFLFNGMSCASATACTAVGYARAVDGPTNPLVESWDGTSWSRVPSPGPGRDAQFYGVSCASASACTATGFHANAKGHWKTLVESGTAAG